MENTTITSKFNVTFVNNSRIQTPSNSSSFFLIGDGILFLIVWMIPLLFILMYHQQTRIRRLIWGESREPSIKDEDEEQIDQEEEEEEIVEKEIWELTSKDDGRSWTRHNLSPVIEEETPSSNKYLWIAALTSMASSRYLDSYYKAYRTCILNNEGLASTNLFLEMFQCYARELRNLYKNNSFLQVKKHSVGRAHHKNNKLQNSFYRKLNNPRHLSVAELLKAHNIQLSDSMMVIQVGEKVFIKDNKDGDIKVYTDGTEQLDYGHKIIDDERIEWLTSSEWKAMGGEI